MPLRPLPPIPNIISPHSSNPQCNQIHFPSLRLQSLGFRSADLALLDLPLTCMVRLCRLIDTVCSGEGGDAGKACIKDLLRGRLRLRFLSAFVARGRGVAIAVIVASRRAWRALRA